MPLTFDIVGGADAWHFTINPQTGELSFVTPRDFEEPIDANEDNVYEVIVSVSDGIDTTTQAMTVTVTDVAENIPPQITSPAAVTIPENQTAVTTITATDPDAASEVPPQDPFPVEGQLPNLLDAYPVANRPSFPVAGVHYRVGLPLDVTLKNPATAPLPPNCDRVVSLKQFWVNGTASIEEFDFSGWDVIVMGGAPIFWRCKFVRGFLTYRADGQANGGTVSDCLFDQQGAADSVCLLRIMQKGDYFVERNEFRNSYHMHAQFTNGGQVGASYIFRNNLLVNAGLGSQQGAHGDWLQMFGGYVVKNIEIYGNTVVQDLPGAATQGWSLSASNPTVKKGLLSRNVMIVKTNTNYVVLLAQNWHEGPFPVEDNFIDPTGVGGAFAQLLPEWPGPYSGAAITFARNKDLRTGAGVA